MTKDRPADRTQAQGRNTAVITSTPGKHPRCLRWEPRHHPPGNMPCGPRRSNSGRHDLPDHGQDPIGRDCPPLGNPTPVRLPYSTHPRPADVPDGRSALNCAGQARFNHHSPGLCSQQSSPVRVFPVPRIVDEEVPGSGRIYDAGRLVIRLPRT